MKKSKIKILIFLILTIIGSSYLFINIIIGDDNFKILKSLINNEQRQLIKKYIFPYKLIFQQEQLISQQHTMISERDQKINSILSELVLFIFLSALKYDFSSFLSTPFTL